MKFKILFKTPDAVDYALEDIERDLPAHTCDESFDPCSHCDGLKRVKDFCEKFVEYGECVSIEFDTEKETATVVPLKKR